MTLKYIGQKKGMTQVFDKSGNAIVCSVILVEPNFVTQIKNKETDGYTAVQIGAIAASKPEKRMTKPLLGHYKRANIKPQRHLIESRIDKIDEFKVGQELGLNYFTDVQFVDVTGTSKGKGFQGVMKLYGFKGGPAAHGSGFHRHAGSTGMRSTPGRCLPGGKRANRMGGEQVTMQSLEVVKLDPEKRLLIVKGAIPGSKDGIVYISKAVKK